MRRNTLLVDAGVALVLAILVIVISPGLAVAGLLAILVVVLCAVSFRLDRRRRRRRRRGGRSRRDEGLDRSGLRESPESSRARPRSSSRSSRSSSQSPRSRPPRSRR